MVWVVLSAGTLLFFGVSLWWHLSLDEMSFLGIGGTCLTLSWLVWRHGLIAFAWHSGYESESGNRVPPTEHAVAAPLHPWILAPLLIVVGAVFIMAATPTGVGGALHGPASGAVSAYELAEASWNLILAASLVVGGIGGLLMGLVRREPVEAIVGGVLLGLVAFGYGGSYLIYLTNKDAYREEWDTAVEPVRIVLGLFG